MCGIAGVVEFDRRPADVDDVRAMCDALVHRGPDAQGLHVDGSVALGQRRLKIIDLEGGKQPMANEDGQVWVTFNGEIYNYREVRRELKARGHRFRTESDTEVIVHAYEEYGAACVDHLRGMFAFAVWDARHRRMLLARDRVGKKPLFYTRLDDRFLFASEMQALLSVPDVPREVDVRALDTYLNFGYIPAPQTIFEGIHKLPPAHTLQFDIDADGRIEGWDIERYWRLNYEPKHSLNERDATKALETTLTEAVQLRMIADVPLGVLLSGGLDSSLIVAMMSRLSNRPVKTFSVGFNDQTYNELGYARSVANHCKTDHHELIVEPQSFDILPKLVRHYGEPYADSSALATYLVSKLTREHVTVALNGDGGDECFAGYDRHQGLGLADAWHRLPSMLRHGALEPMADLLPDSLSQLSRWGQVKRFVQRAGAPPSEQYVNWVTYFPAELRQRLYNADTRAELAGHSGRDWMTALFAEHQRRTSNTLDAALALDVESYLPGDLLVKMDIATMACSLEARSPLLDHHVMEFCAQLPVSLKRKGMTSKRLLRRLAADYVPKEILTRRKMGFGLPMAKWLRQSTADSWMNLMTGPDARIAEYFDPTVVQEIVKEHRVQKIDRAPRLWSLLWLECWLREVRDGCPENVASASRPLVPTIER